jgi:hypothetical protein
MKKFERWARTFDELHPDAQAILKPFFPDFDVSLVRVRVLWHPLKPAVFVTGRTLNVLPGTLDADHEVRGRIWSWTRPDGIALWGHECYHVKQYMEGRLGTRDVLRGIFDSLRLKGTIYCHDVIPYEQEAIHFEKTLYRRLTNHLR